MAKIWIPAEDNILLEVIGRVLRRAGHSVAPCFSSGLAGRRIAQARRGENVMIVDLASPGECRSALMMKLQIPALKILFVTEHPVHHVDRNCRLLVRSIGPAHRAAVLWRPFTKHDLLQKVDELLGAREEVDRQPGLAHADSPAAQFRA